MFAAPPQYNLDLQRMTLYVVHVLFMKAYKQYIRSEEWRELRRAALDHYSENCDKCGRRLRLQVHHQNYTREGLGSLRVLCEDCHEQLHYAKKIIGDKMSPRKLRKINATKRTAGGAGKVTILPRPGLLTAKEARKIVDQYHGPYQSLPNLGRATVLRNGRRTRLLVCEAHGLYRLSE
jgi:hypothetical protein